MTGAPTALLTAGLAASIAALPSRAGAVYVRDDMPVALYNALAEQPQYAAAGYPGLANGPSTGDRCSGVLVAPDAFLTAAHTDVAPAKIWLGDPAGLGGSGRRCCRPQTKKSTSPVSRP